MFPKQIFSGDRHALTDLIGVDLGNILSLCAFHPLDDLVILSGSIVEGFGNRSSDIDLFVVRENGSPNPESIVYEPNSKKYVDITYLDKDELASLIKRIREIQVVPLDWVSLKCAAFSDIDTYHRLMIGVALTDPAGGDWHKLKFCPRSLGREIAYQNIVAARARWNDAVGAFLDGQEEQAAYVARITFEHAVDAYSALHGETNPSPKWRWARLQRLAGSGRDHLGVFESFRKAIGLTHRIGVEELIQHAGGMLSEAQSLLARGRFLELEPLTDPCSRYEPVGDFDYVLTMADGGEVLAERCR